MRLRRAAAIAAGALLAVFAASAEARVTAAVVWRPAAGFMAGFHVACDGLGGKRFDACDFCQPAP